MISPPSNRYIAVHGAQYRNTPGPLRDPLSHRRGRDGEVYKAKDSRLDRTVAIKVLPEHLAESRQRKQRFEREATKGESLDILEFIARVPTQIFAVGRPSKRPRNISYPRRSPNADDSEPRKHGVHYFGVYASRSRVFRKKRAITLHSLGDNDHSKSKAEPELSPKKRAALRKSWAQLIKRVYQVDPLKCQCGGTLRVIGFITEHKVIRTFSTTWTSETATPALLQNTDSRFRHSRLPRPRHAAPLVRLLATTQRDLKAPSPAPDSSSTTDN